MEVPESGVAVWVAAATDAVVAETAVVEKAAEERVVAEKECPQIPIVSHAASGSHVQTSNTSSRVSNDAAAECSVLR